MLPPAPPTFSTMTGCPSDVLIRSAITRPGASEGPTRPRLPTWHAAVHGSYRTNTGKVILALIISAGDPKRTNSASGCCSALALVAQVRIRAQLFDQLDDLVHDRL